MTTETETGAVNTTGGENTLGEIALDSVESALDSLRSGGMVVVVDDLDRENEGDIVVAADTVTAETIGFMIRHTSGFLCTPMPAERAESLGLHPMLAVNEDPKGTAYTVTCDAVEGTTTGISGADRAQTARVLANPTTTKSDLSRPGHVIPLRGVPGGVLARRGHTEASIDLSVMAGHEPVAVIGELNHDDGTMMRLPALRAFADEHGLPLISIEDLVAYRERTEGARRLAVELRDDEIRDRPRAAAPEQEAAVAETDRVTLPTADGIFTVQGWRRADGTEHMTLTAETPEGSEAAAPLVRVHSECLTGDVFGSYRCDCGEQLEKSLGMIQAEGGTVVYVRGHEGRGIGLFEKLRAYALQEAGRDTLDANLELGFPADARDYSNTASILRAMGMTEIRLITNNPAKTAELEKHGINVVGTVPCEVPSRPENSFYLKTKADRMNHSLSAK